MKLGKLLDVIGVSQKVHIIVKNEEKKVIGHEDGEGRNCAGETCGKKSKYEELKVITTWASDRDKLLVWVLGNKKGE